MPASVQLPQPILDLLRRSADALHLAAGLSQGIFSGLGNVLHCTHQHHTLRMPRIVGAEAKGGLVRQQVAARQVKVDRRAR